MQVDVTSNQGGVPSLLRILTRKMLGVVVLVAVSMSVSVVLRGDDESQESRHIKCIHYYNNINTHVSSGRDAILPPT